MEISPCARPPQSATRTRGGTIPVSGMAIPASVWDALGVRLALSLAPSLRCHSWGQSSAMTHLSISFEKVCPYFCPHSCGQKYGQSLFCGVPLFSGGVFSGRVFSGGLFFFSSTVYGQRAGEFRRSFCHASREPLPSTLPSIVTSTVTSILDGR